MKFAAVTLLLATLALANPAPVAEPEAAAAPAPVAEAEPIQIESRDALDGVLAARIASPQLDARTAGLKLAPRDPKKSKPKTSSSNTNDTDAAVSLTPSRALQLGALGLGVMEVVRLWG